MRHSHLKTLLFWVVLSGCHNEVSHAYRNGNSSYFIHIPKTGGTAARHVLNDDAMKFGVGELCEHGHKGTPKEPDENWEKWPGSCWLHMSEGHSSTKAKHQFTLLRDPRQHVLSMYHHCKEAPQHTNAKNKAMPSLNEWLHSWATALNASHTDSEGAVAAQQDTPNALRRYKCYNPLNMQSKRLGYPKDQDELQTRVDIAGLTEEFERSLCLVSILAHDAVPRRCKCNSSAHPSPSRKAPAPSKTHGVKHHSDTFETTPAQDADIAAITQLDQALWHNAQQLFDGQVRLAESRHDFTLCQFGHSVASGPKTHHETKTWGSESNATGVNISAWTEM